MTKYILISIALLLSCNALLNAQGWTWQNPLPQGNDLNEISIINEDIAYAVGDVGTIIKTVDGGESWEVLSKINNYNNFSVRDITGVYFINENTGFAVSSDYGNHLVFKTTDAGETWSSYNVGERFSSVLFIDQNIGFIAGGHCESAGCYGKMKKTTDGGESWYEVFNQPDVGVLASVYFIDGITGYAVSRFGNIFKSIDGGENWTLIRSINGILYSVYFVDENIGYTTGSITLKTTDGGITWSDLYVNNNLGWMRSVYFLDPQIGFLSGPAGLILKTTDGGMTWETQYTGLSFSLNSIKFTGDDTGLCVGDNGQILKTIDTGTNWTTKTEGPRENNNDVFFINNTTGFIAGDEGMLLKTTDGGANWQEEISGVSASLNTVYFVNDNTGYAAGEEGTIIKTTDGGINWTTQYTGTSEEIRSIQFVDENTGYAAGGYGIVLRTNNGGYNWETYDISGISSPTLYSVSVIDEDTVYIAGTLEQMMGARGQIFKTVNGGDDWELISDIGSTAFYDIFFISGEVGFVSGHEVIMKTMDGGESWIDLDLLWPYKVYSIYFINQDTGYFAGGKNGSYDERGIVLKTMDGGSSISLFFEWDPYPSGEVLNSVYFPNSDTGFLVGNHGTILKTESGGMPVAISEPEKPIINKSSEILLYPNPCTNHLTIEYEIEGATDSKLIIYNQLGKEMDQIEFNNSDPGKHSIQYDTHKLPSGIYFISIKNRNKIAVEKIIKL